MMVWSWGVGETLAGTAGGRDPCWAVLRTYQEPGLEGGGAAG